MHIFDPYVVDISQLFLKTLSLAKSVWLFKTDKVKISLEISFTYKIWNICISLKQNIFFYIFLWFIKFLNDTEKSKYHYFSNSKWILEIRQLLDFVSFSLAETAPETHNKNKKIQIKSIEIWIWKKSDNLTIFSWFENVHQIHGSRWIQILRSANRNQWIWSRI